MINFIDIGCGEKLPLPWSARKGYGNIKYYLGCDPSGKFQHISKKYSFKKTFLHKKAIFDTEGEQTFYECEGSQQSSLFRPNTKVLKKYLNRPNRKKQPSYKRKRFNVKSIQKIKCVRLDSILNDYDIDFDFIKTDTQGADFNVIKSLGKYLDTQIIGIHIELFYKELYEGIVLFEEVDNFLKGYGFYKAKRIPGVDRFWSDFLYMKNDPKKCEKIRLIKKIYK